MHKKWREQFKSVENCHYLISNSLGAMPNKARDSQNEYLDIWESRGARAWMEDWWTLTKDIGDKVARIIGAPDNTISMHANVTSCEATVLSCFDFSQGNKRNKVVMVDMEFPSILYLYQEWLRDSGKVEIIKSKDGITIPTQEVLDAIDETTVLVPISLVLFRSSYIVDAKAIIEKAHSVGAMVVLDIFQAVGTVPVDVTALGVDFVVGGTLKWVCGGPGACFLYVNPAFADSLSPKFTGWFAHKNPFEFSNKKIEMTSGSYRFQNGTSAVPALYSCQAGLDIIHEAGIDNIRKYSTEMTTKLLAMANDRNWKTTTPLDSSKRGGTVALDLDNAYDISVELNNRDYLVDYRPMCGVRISPHFYNTMEELDDVIAEIEKIIEVKKF